MSNPFDKNESTLTSTEQVVESKNQNNNIQKDQHGNPIIQSTLLKRVGGTPMEERLKRFPGEVDKLSNESGSHCGASPFEITKQDHSKLNSANTLNQHIQQNGDTAGINQSVSLSSNQQKSVSLEKNSSDNINNNISNNNNNNSNINKINNQRKSSIDDDNSFVTVPFSPPMKAFSLEKSTSNSELPYMNPDGNTNNNLTTSTDPLLNPGIDRSYYNMNSRIGSNIPLDDPNNQDITTRVTTAVRNSPQVNNLNDNDNENGPMVNININPGTFAEPNGAEIPVVVRRRRNEDTIGVVVMICVILIIIGGCIAFLFL